MAYANFWQIVMSSFKQYVTSGGGGFFPRYEEFRGRSSDSYPACALYNNNSNNNNNNNLRGGHLEHTISTFYARICPQWHSELKRLWPCFPWRVVCGLVFLTGFHTMPEQHSQPTTTSLCQRCMLLTCNLPPAVFGRMAGVYYVPLQ